MTKADTLLQAIADELKQDPIVAKIPDAQLKSIILEIIETTYVTEAINTKQLLQLTDVVIQLAKFQSENQ